MGRGLYLVFRDFRQNLDLNSTDDSEKYVHGTKDYVSDSRGTKEILADSDVKIS